MGVVVQMNKAAQIRQTWKRDGEQPCSHERFDKEYHLGSDTGDYVCLTCGVSWWRDDPKPPPEPSAKT